MADKTPSCAVLISSFDGYSDAWKPFFELFFRYWPDCPYPVYLIANSKSYPDERVKMIHIKNDRGWSANLIEAVQKIASDYIIYFQEDYFLDQPVDTGRVKKMLEIISREDAAYLRIKQGRPDLPYKDYQDIGKYSPQAPYRNSTQTAIWESKSLWKLLDEKESGWDFELRGGIERSRQMKKPFLSIKVPLISYFATAIVRGRYLYDAVKFCHKEGIEVDTNARPVESWGHYVWRKSPLSKPIRKVILYLAKETLPGRYLLHKFRKQK